VLSDGPSGYWRLGETSGTTAIDSSGADNGTYTNGPTLAQASLLPGDSANRSVRFDGINDHVRVPSSGSLSPGVRVSAEAWIKPTSLPTAGSFASILTKAESYSLQFNGPRLEFTIMQSGVRRRLQAPSGAIVAGQTYHVVGTYDGTTQRLYINGTQVASTPLTSAVTSNSNPLFIAAWNATSEFFKGTIDEAAVYGSILSASRVLAHYNAGTSTSQASTSQTASLNSTGTSAGKYSIASPPTFVDYCRLPSPSEEESNEPSWLLRRS
jgi:hypothetical protein